MSTDTGTAGAVLFSRILGWTKHYGIGRKVAIGLIVCALIAGISTYTALTGAGPFGPDPATVRTLFLIDLALLLILAAVVARRLVRLWVERRRGSAGSRLHIRMVGLFSVVAVGPAIFVAAFSILFFNFVIQGWFNERIQEAVRNSMAVAEAYLKEHRDNIRTDALAMANDLNQAASLLRRNPAAYRQLVAVQAEVRSLSEAMVIDSNGKIIARSGLTFLMEFGDLTQDVLERARDETVVVLSPVGEDRVRALVKLQSYLDSYLIVGRVIESSVIEHVERTRSAVSRYEKLERERRGIEITFVLIFIVVALLVLLAAVWFGLSIANRIVSPVGALVGAAERVRQGDLTANVPEGGADDEIGTLSRAFNRMTSQLAGQRNELIEANKQLDERRMFTEAVLSGVSAGVIGLDRNGRVNLPNRSAIDLLGMNAEDLINRDFAEAVPEMGALVKEARRKRDRTIQGQVNILRNGKPRNLLVRVTVERAGSEAEGIVVTFDDVTELMTAQRTAAWADVARRIAHEIKNPLTPIQLSAERLKRKYLREVESDPTVFTQCTDTIIRQVADIGRMVDEFSSFARMPAPIFQVEDLTEIVRQELFHLELTNTGIDYTFTPPADPVRIRCDGRQVAQALSNLLRNAADAIAGQLSHEGDEEQTKQGRIAVTLGIDDYEIWLEVADNGPGLPADLRDQLTEPYVTTKEKGTGLGLAIVKKIMEEHGGFLDMHEAENGDTAMRLVFPATSLTDNHSVDEGQQGEHDDTSKTMVS